MQQSSVQPAVLLGKIKIPEFQAGGERNERKVEEEKLVAECCQAGSAIITKVEGKKIRSPGPL